MTNKDNVYFSSTPDGCFMRYNQKRINMAIMADWREEKAARQAQTEAEITDSMKSKVAVRTVGPGLQGRRFLQNREDLNKAVRAGEARHKRNKHLGGVFGDKRRD